MKSMKSLWVVLKDNIHFVYLRNVRNLIGVKIKNYQKFDRGYKKVIRLSN